jgi:hypothetical protein
MITTLAVTDSMLSISCEERKKQETRKKEVYETAQLTLGKR